MDFSGSAEQNKKREKILVAMSGGVDSTGAARLLQKEGYTVEGAVMRLTEDNTPAETAEQVCGQLGIPLHVFDFRKQFRENVEEYFTRTYLKGETPNPCVECNKKIKFGLFLQEALKMGFDRVATGHYVTIAFNGETGRYEVRRAKNLKKDQSYFLYRLDQQQLSRVICPLAEYEKEDLRRMLEEEGLVNARKSDSQDICFVPDGNYGGFIQDFTGKMPPKGNFLDESGHILGTHDGIIYYTVGQRKGVKTAFGKPLYVKSKNPDTNEVVMAEDSSLFSGELTALSCNLISVAELPAGGMRVTVKTRSVQRDVPATIYQEGDKIHVVFDVPQRAITPGQSAVFYHGETVVGGGYIANIN